MGGDGMGRRNRVAVVVVAGLGMAALAGCAAARDTTVRDSSDVQGKVTSVRLDTAAGRVTLRGASATEVTVHRVVRYGGAEPDERSYDVSGVVLTLHGCGDRCAVDYTVDLPAGLPVTGRTEAGAVRLTDVGRVGLTTESGAVEIDGASGPVNVRTQNGEISGHGLAAGPVGAQTVNGAIDLAITAPSDVKAETSNGSIRLTVPDAPYRVSARTHNGDAHNIGVPDDPSATHRLELSTSNGDIEVHKS